MPRHRAAAEYSLVVNAVPRRYLLHVPPDLPPCARVPLVLVFHPLGARASFMPRFTGFSDLADRERFIVAYPNSRGWWWNDGRGRIAPDDVLFIRALLDELERLHPIDPRRIYATGFSSGGFFSSRLACEMPDRIAAIASVGATIAESIAEVCKARRPMPVLYVHGTKDPLVPFEGGSIGFHAIRGFGQCLSLADTAKFWCRANGIVLEPSVEDLPDRADDGTRVRRELWSGGRPGAEVVAYTMFGAGHTWPCGPQYLPKFMIGRVSRNLDATAEIWRFFSRHALPIR